MFKTVISLTLTSLLVTIGNFFSPQVPHSTPNSTPTPIPQKIASNYYSSLPIISHGDRNSPQISLTLDADMTPNMKNQLSSGQISSWYNSDVIQILQQTQTPATIFLTGMWIETYPQITQELAINPLFELANHSYSHPSFSQPCFKLSPIPDSQNQYQIDTTQQLLSTVAGITNQFFRFPGGCYNPNDLQTVHQLGLIPIQWDSVGPDSFNTNTDKAITNLTHQTQNGSIIALHLHGGPNAPKTAEILSELIPLMKQKGFEFVKLSTLLSTTPSNSTNQ